MADSNFGYWIAYPLPDESVPVLRRVKNGEQRFYRDRFEVAYLISRDCVEADLEKKRLAITPKGEDALRFFEE